MITRMAECGRHLSRDDIEGVEDRIGIHFPDDYVAFLLKYNGGRPTPNGYRIDGLGNNPYGVVQVFFGIDDPIASCNVDWMYQQSRGRVPANLLPIACDDGNDLICVSMLGPDVGAVIFWDQHTEPTTPGYGNVYRIAGSFGEFINGLRDLPRVAG